MPDAPITREWIQALGPIVVSLIVSGLWAWLTHLSRLAHERSLEAERRVGQQALEVLKSELTFDAEVRRQVASRRVEALLHVVGLGLDLAVELNAAVAHPDLQQGTRDWNRTTAMYLQAVKAAAPLLTSDVSIKLIAYSEDVQRDISSWRQMPTNLALFDRAIARSNDLLAVARKELFIDAGTEKS